MTSKFRIHVAGDPVNKVQPLHHMESKQFLRQIIILYVLELADRDVFCRLILFDQHFRQVSFGQKSLIQEYDQAGAVLQKTFVNTFFPGIVDGAPAVSRLKQDRLGGSAALRRVKTERVAAAVGILSVCRIDND